MRMISDLGNNWRYVSGFRDEFTTTDFDDSGWANVNLPHSNIELPYNGFDEQIYQFISCYRKTLEIPAEAEGRRTILRFEGVMLSCSLWINGAPAGEHRGGYTPFEVDISSLVIPGEPAVLAVMVDSREDASIPPFGKVVDFLTYGGIYREVSLIIRDELHIAGCTLVSFAPGTVIPGPATAQDRFTAAALLSGDDALARFRVRLAGLKAPLQISSPQDTPRDGLFQDMGLRLTLENARADGLGDGVPDSSGDVNPSSRLLNQEIRLADLKLDDDGTSGEVHFEIHLPRVELWDMEYPALYRITLELWEDAGGADHRIRDDISFRTGFRTAEFRPEGFFLNGRPVKLIGLNRHQSYPYAGYAMPARVQRKDADILNDELGVNMVRTSHYPQSPHFLDRCDERGVLVMEEIPGWQHIGDDQWKIQSLSDTRDMITRDAHHPSIILWGVRINESPDDHDFFAASNALARSLDPLRQTGGVRNFAGSEILEDVYTFNEFHHNGVLRPIRSRRSIAGKKVPFLVTEHNGHMYPTKRFDQEHRLVEHALRHARVIQEALMRPDVCGAIGWCAFDYNTHREFGSGDRICYHGVMDMFRIPKYAGHLYASQQDYQRRPVLEPLTLFALGERDEAKSLPVYVATNFDSIRVYRNSELVGEYYPDRSRFPGLVHPPVLIDELVGRRLESFGFPPRVQTRLKRILARIFRDGVSRLRPWHWAALGWTFLSRGISLAEGERMLNHAGTGWGDGEQIYELAGIAGGEEKLRKTYGSPVASSISVAPDDLKLSAGSRDATRVVFRLLDQYGNLVPWVNEYLELNIEGPGEIIGPARSALVGGVMAVWIATTGKPGIITLTSRCGRFPAPGIKILVD